MGVSSHCVCSRIDAELEGASVRDCGIVEVGAAVAARELNDGCVGSTLAHDSYDTADR
ncbi:hypothetical protein D3C87_1898620 [compost metagenome]